MTNILLNGALIGTTDRPQEFVMHVREKRRGGTLSSQVNAGYDESSDEIRINTDNGRVRRPLIVVENGKPLLTRTHIDALAKGKAKWDDLVKEGVVEYLDPEEEENTSIALYERDVTKSTTHLELNPLAILGISSSIIPYGEYDRGDRVNYGAKMIGQTVGHYASNYFVRTDTKANLLVYPQIPLVSTITYPILGIDRHPAGQNIVIALMSYDGYNMEDAVVVNKSSVQRGLGRSFFYRTYQTEEMRYGGGQVDEIKTPEKDVRGYLTEKDYAFLDEDGIINPETEVKGGDVLVGKTSPLRFLGRDDFLAGIHNRRETSLTVRHGEAGVVDKVLVTETKDGNKTVKVTVREQRIPEIGDKFASRHGQKGVIGLLVPQEDMPFTADGVKPDVIMNPHSIPSRLTVGQLIEMLAGKAGALDGRFVDGTMFNGESEDSLREALRKLGFRNDGKEKMYNGRTGEAMEAEIFIGSVYYLRLEHMVANKIHARSRGPVALLTKQPTEGRANEGGLRFGEMEKDCLIAHGASLLLKERFSSDLATMPVCTKCGLIAIQDYNKNRVYCLHCKNSKIVDVEMAYAFKLMLDELKALMVYPNLNVVATKPAKFKSIQFGMLSPAMIRKMGTVEITRPELYDRDGYPIEGGVMDPRLGVIDPGMRCRICGGSVGTCLGHFGYLELARPIIHVRYIKTIYKLLRSTCESCGRALDTRRHVEDIEEVVGELVAKKRDKCQHCGVKQGTIRLGKPYTFTLDNKPMNALKIREWFERIPDEDAKKLGIHGGRPEWMIITLLPTPPTTMRPSITLETGERSEDDLTHKLVDIVRINQRLRDNIIIGAPDFIVEDLHELLQYHVSTFFDNELSGVPQARHRSGRALRTLTQRLKGKEGRFRNNLTGKRVNFSARTVISPDPKLSITEVGVPEIIAKELTIPVKINEMNIAAMKSMVKRGPEELDGANYVIRPDGRKKKITDENKDELSEEIEAGYIVERHLKDGDTVIFNRQPSLHRMSVMAHRVRIMPGKTFRLNLCVCKPYNADFDGDEMNLHVPQTEEAQAEAELLMLVQKHIRSPRFGGPIIGCTQDHISGLYLLTRKGTIVRKDIANQMLANVHIDATVDRDVTGKDLFSLVLPKDLNMRFNNILSALDPKSEDANVVIKDGALVQGVIDAKAVGGEKGLLLDRIEKLYGNEEARLFLDRASNLGLEWLARRGFTISTSELDITPAAKRKITTLVNQGEEQCKQLIKELKAGKIEILPGMTARESLEAHIMRVLGETLENASRAVSEDMTETNAVVMARSGARGSMVNLTHLSGMIGQMTLQGERIQRGYRERTLPHFARGELGPREHGFVVASFKDGLNPFEFFFNAMNGREGLMDKSLRTRHSGYMERRLVNALQDLKIEYDGTIRDDRKNIIQFIPSEDAIDPSKSEWGTIDIEGIVESMVEGS
ncbi:MAG: DNA-directed RNA polymerase subunit A' [Candidatus Aenigmarchaeota archaeon]|nr:DNA-directed RNA polymerase subunit A' [Candidatus Aenigmarchaeota archaeon]